MPVTSQRMSLGRGGNEVLHRSPDGIEHLGIERAHDVGDLHWVVGFGEHPTSQLGHHGDRWMVPIVRLSARPLSLDPPMGSASR